MGGVDLHAIEAGFLGALRRGGEAGDGRGDVIRRHLPRRHRLIRDLEDGVRYRRGRDRRLAANVGAGVSAGMAELDRGLGAAGMNRGSQECKPRQEAVIIDAELASAVAAGSRWRGHLDRDQSHPTAHPRHVVVDDLLGDEALGVRKPRGHWRHDDAVFDFKATDGRRRQENVHRG
jgi:hypothetical protein